MEIQRQRRARLTAAQWAEAVAAYRRSGQTQTAFARSLGVGVAALRNWLYRDRPAAPRRSDEAGGFVPVRAIGGSRNGAVAGAAMPGAALVVRWPAGASVEVHVAPSTPGVAEPIAAPLGPCSR